MAVLVYTRFGIDDLLFRDEAIYAYGGQQLVEGVPPYVSIVDPKTPLATVLSGAAVAAGRAFGIDDVYAIRVGFFVLTCLTLVAVFVAASLLTGSSMPGLAAAATFISFRGFAIDALGGPNAKTPGILFAVLATALLLQRRWFLGGIAVSLAVLVWQPLVIYAVAALAFAWFASGRADRRRNIGATLAGLVIPGAVTIVYFAVAGAFDELFQTAFLLPLVGTQRAESTFVDHIVHIAVAVARGYGLSSILFWGGIIVLLALAASRIWNARAAWGSLGRDPLIVLVVVPLLFFMAFSLVDFQSYPDAYPFLPLAAFGIACGAALAIRWMDGRGLRPAALAIVGTASLVVAVLTWAWYGQPRPAAEARALITQRRDAAAAEQILGPDGTFYALGDPAPLVLMQRRNPSPEIYLAAGVDAWVIEHKPGGFDGWTQEIAASEPDMVMLSGWHGPQAARMRDWLRSEFERIQIGEGGAFVTPEVRDRATGPTSAILLRYRP